MLPLFWLCLPIVFSLIYPQSDAYFQPDVSLFLSSYVSHLVFHHLTPLQLISESRSFSCICWKVRAYIPGPLVVKAYSGEQTWHWDPHRILLTPIFGSWENQDRGAGWEKLCSELMEWFQCLYHEWGSSSHWTLFVLNQVVPEQDERLSCGKYNESERERMPGIGTLAVAWH